MARRKKEKARRKPENPWNPLVGQNAMGWDEWQMRHSGEGGDQMRQKYEQNALGPGGANYMGGASLDQIKENINQNRTYVYPLIQADFIASRKNKPGKNLENLLKGIPPDAPPGGVPTPGPDDAASRLGEILRERGGIVNAPSPDPKGGVPGGPPPSRLVPLPGGAGEPHKSGEPRFNPTTGRTEDYQGFLKREGTTSSALNAGRFLTGVGGKITEKMRQAMKAAANSESSRPKKKERPRRER